jgi:hypothetical protein
MVCAEIVPESIEDLWIHTHDKYSSARAQPITSEVLLYPERVRDVQSYAFFAEDYTVDAYEQLMSSVPDDLTDSQIKNTDQSFIEEMDDYAVEIFIEETTDITPPPLIEFPAVTSTEPTSPTGTTPTTSTTNSPSSPPSSSPNFMDAELLLPMAVGVVSGLALVMIAVLIKRRLT